MAFTEPAFLLFFVPLALLGFWAAARIWGKDAALVAVLIASCLFYAAYGLRVFTLMAAGTLINGAVCLALIRLPGTRQRLRVGLFWSAQAWNFGTLALFKYLAPMVGLAQATEGSAIPVGISFYTFQQAALLVDAFNLDRRVVQYLPAGRPVGGMVRFGAFHTFFPQLVVGPITYLSEFGPQALSQRFGRFKRTDLEVGLTLIAIGLFKKVVIADSLGRITAPVFDGLAQGAPANSAQAWLAVTGYFAQLYFDFSGYSDMALGLARLFGIRLPFNFDSPLRASGIADFYRRWHITLTRVIGRFLFTPLSLWGARTAAEKALPIPAARALSAWGPMLVNFQVIALWHAALPTFMLFGLIHGLWFILETEVRATKRWRRFKKATTDTFRLRVGQALTILPLMLTFALFRSADLQVFASLVQALPLTAPAPVNWPAAAQVAGAFALIWLAPNSQELLRRYRPGIRTWNNPSTTPGPLRVEWRPTLLWGLFVAGLLLGALSMIAYRTPFIYMGY
ncbi:MBOAT family protein [Caulobacter sp. SLTY]|uniref:MBOAT family protein n=1 Tax=Caulobacter sp. SLTY TaxID=2683262 RepID=UPI00141316AC|nr:MBOAT family protein [Caulobacter sp. SLTY]